jgi:hypothetical protein
MRSGGQDQFGREYEPIQITNGQSEGWLPYPAGTALGKLCAFAYRHLSHWSK